jgi:dephospho-CoA kinase
MLGKLRSGKSTVTQLIKELVKEVHGIDLVSRPLATPIYEEAKSFYDRHGLVWRKNRKLLEAIGEALNDDYPKGDKIVELYKQSMNEEEHIIVEDCRRITQANFLKQWKDTILIRVSASKEVRKARCKPGEWSEGAITDTELDDYPVDCEVINDGEDLIELKKKVELLVRHSLLRH